MDAALPRPALPLTFGTCESLGRFATNLRFAQDLRPTEQRDYQLLTSTVPLK